jgi:hypothetical protein
LSNEKPGFEKARGVFADKERNQKEEMRFDPESTPKRDG